MEMIPENIIELFVRNVNGLATEAEQRALQQWMDENEEAKSRLMLMQNFWQQESAQTPYDVEKSLQSVLQKLQLPYHRPPAIVPITKPISKPKHFGWWKVASVAAVFFILLFFSIQYYIQSSRVNGPATQLAQLDKVVKQNSKGAKSIIELPDGSKVWLNAESSLEYTTDFTGKTREVTLIGEAFFNVAKDATKPFIIHLNKGTIRVLGTSFNVRAYENEATVETTVSTGKVAFIPKKILGKENVSDTVFLTPNNKATYDLQKEVVRTAMLSADEDKAWTRGELIFKDKSLAEVAVVLERNFNRKILFQGETLQPLKITASFTNDGLQDILFYLSKATGFKFREQDNTIIIYE